MRRPPRCGACGSSKVRRIIYGLPSGELGSRAERGDVVLGGCVISDNDPAWDCADCGRQFGNDDRPYEIALATLSALQRQRLKATTNWAHKIRATLQPIITAHGDRVHFRPSSTGVAMVGLLPDRPQRGKSGMGNLESVVANFEALFANHCRDIEQGRVTGEKALQAYLIRESQVNGRKMAPLNLASTASDDPVELLFVTDEITLPVGHGGKIVCDILTLRVDGGRSTPVLLELKDSRQLSRLVEQVEGYSQLMDEQADAFAELFGAVLGEPIKFDAPTEKWIVWPAAGAGADPRDDELRAKGIRVVGYEVDEKGYRFRIGTGIRS